MKKIKIVSSLLIVLFVCSIAFGASPGRELGHNRGDVMGNIGRYNYDPHRKFRLVRYVPLLGEVLSQTLTANAVVVWDVNSDDGVTVTVTSTSYVSTIAGIIVQDALTPTKLGRTAAQDLGRRNWTWLQTYGPSLARVQIDADLVSAGKALATGSQWGLSTNFLPSTTDAALQGNGGFWYDTAGAGTQGVEVFLRCE